MKTDLKPKLNTRTGRWYLASAELCADGKWRTRSVPCGKATSEAEAWAFRHAYMAAQNSQRPDRITVGDLIDDYLDEARDRDVREGQFQALKQIKALLGAFEPEQVTIDAQRDYGRQRKISIGSQIRELGAMNTVFKWAVKNGKLDAGRKPILRTLPTPSPRKNWLNEPDEARLWGLAAEDRDRKGRLSLTGLFICLALGTGQRAGAIYALTWDRVDLAAEKIDFRVPNERLTNKRKVFGDINKRLLPVLHRARADYPYARKVILNNLRGSLESFFARHGFDVTPHVFRHTFVTLMLRAGASVWEVADQVGMTPEMVQKVYGHHARDERRKSIANLRFPG